MHDVITLHNEKSHRIAKEFNTIIKTYFDGTKKLKFHKFSNTKGISYKKKSGGCSSEEDRKYSRYKNMYRSKQNLIDLVYHNSMIMPWELFVTLEFNANDVDYKDFEVVSELLSKWLNNMKHQNPYMRYVFVPELHPTSGGVHFHGLVANCPNLIKKLQVARNPHNNHIIYKNKVKIYNLTNYKLGYTTASFIQNQEAVSVYMSKYMTKELIDLNFKKRYWRSYNLEIPNIEYAYFNDKTLKFYIDKGVEKMFESDKTIAFEIKNNICCGNSNLT